MPSKGVRVSRQQPQPPKVRRRPLQSRAQATSQALQDAFVRLVIEQGYERTTVREVAAVAGVGLGTFYEYFGNMDTLAAMCIHRQVQTLHAQGLQTLQGCAGMAPATRVDRLLDTLVDGIAREAPMWSALFMLERKVSAPEPFRRHYQAYVQLWAMALQDCDPPLPEPAQPLARLLHTMTYGWVSQSLLALGPQQTPQQLREPLGWAIHALLRKAQAA
ncbi:TetR/AcrR family transcriptional regulator [Delftia sp. DSM 12781]|uniref:TetR/AcrR family transcriptional regulator n=1 Tax=Delftia sp. WSY_7 TaxID=3367202 RepID=UPI001AE20A74